jgi:hypothetical protein
VVGQLGPSLGVPQQQEGPLQWCISTAAPLLLWVMTDTHLFVKPVISGSFRKIGPNRPPDPNSLDPLDFPLGASAPCSNVLTNCCAYVPC